MSYNVPGTDMIMPGNPYVMALQAGLKIADMAGVDIPGVSDLLGGIGGVFGGGRDVRPGYAGMDTSVFNGTYLEGLNIDGFQSVSGRSYAQGGTPLAQTGRFIADVSGKEQQTLTFLGLNEMAEDLRQSMNLGSFSSQADQRNKEKEARGNIA